LRITIEKVISSGDGIGWGDGKTYFVPGTLPGELVEIVSVDRVRRAFRATDFRIVAPSADRCEPACPLFGRCGGCDFLHMTYPAQVAAKRSIVAELFRQNGRTIPFEPRFVSIGQFGLRTRAKVHIVGGRPAFTRRASHELVPFTDCPLLHPGLNKIIHADAATRSEGTVYYEYAPAGGDWSPRDAVVEKMVRSERFRVSRGSFFQASEEGATALVTLFEELLDELRPSRVVDLFCGVGLFSLFAARRGATVTGMELSEKAGEDFAANLGGKAQFIRADLGHEVRLPPTDLIVVDPPRTGLPPALIPAIAATPAHDICYVSCDGATFVRDLGYLEREGRFTLVDLAIVDQFPATHHIELVARFRRET